jgi:hypothetical protein
LESVQRSVPQPARTSAKPTLKIGTSFIPTPNAVPRLQEVTAARISKSWGQPQPMSQ